MSDYNPFEPEPGKAVKIEIKHDPQSPEPQKPWLLKIGGRVVDWYEDAGAAQQAATRIMCG